MRRRGLLWAGRVVTILAGGTVLQATGGCSEEAMALIAQGTASLIISVVNQLIATAIAGLFNVPTTGSAF